MDGTEETRYLLSSGGGNSIPNRGRRFSHTANIESAQFGSVGRSGMFFGANIASPNLVAFDNNAQNTIKDDEITLLEDNNVSNIPTNSRTTNYDSLSSDGGRLLPHDPVNEDDDSKIINQAWEEAIAKGAISTSIKRETTVLAKYSVPLIITFLLQQSLTTASVFSVGHLGKTELAAVSLAGMTASITGYALIQGIATCLDTLCPQAYGRGDLRIVGLHFLRCTVLMLATSVFIGIIWFNGTHILNYVIPSEPELNYLAGSYLRILLIGLPGYCLFENLKHYLQAQGIFHASTYVLAICAPLNVALNYLLVWNKHIGIGFLGAPIGVVISIYVMSLLLVCYTIFINGYQCWCGFDRTLFQNWNRMIRLAIPGIVMIEAEWLAFEILTLAASRFGTTTLAAQSVIATLASLFFQPAFAISIAASTRVANFIGARLPKAAIMATNVALVTAVVLGCFNGFFVYTFRREICSLFTKDQEVIEVACKVLPIAAFYQINDCLGAITGGILRGQGRQKIGGYLNIFFYYVVALPVAFTLAFRFDFELEGLWLGISIALVFVSFTQAFCVYTSDWDTIIEKSEEENRQEAILVT
ncbi:MATE efflux family protein [Nadsonia fulvescens var. elongata DSM 6958]|uniref:MATE efflux family protein n=1 Tax=Nadsonia fulvescens var. elongata DSM 6958 TaxID=857566 RepID=A0A1E3PD01_9ASCO|nr:MATE efflux family protein [Nadsonia fulvescens var. elongata DSM 6958]